MLKIVIYHQGYYLPNGTKSERKEFKKQNDDIEHELSIQRSVRRTRSVIQDIILCNHFDLWTTFTFSPDKVDRYDISSCMFKMSNWLFNQRKHSPNLKYLIVPELHKDGALHFHALLSNFNGNLSKTKLKTKRGQDIYKFSGYRSGRSQAVYINNNDDDYQRIASYIQKYITKDMPLIYNKRRYWRSRNLQMPKKTINGVRLFKLQNLIKNYQPTYINDCFEVQHHPKISTPLNSDNQVILL